MDAEILIQCGRWSKVIFERRQMFRMSFLALSLASALTEAMQNFGSNF